MARHRWIKGAVRHPGALHHMMGVPEGEKIPAETLRGWNRISKWVIARGKGFHGHGVAWWKKAGQRARFALRARTFKHKRRRRR